jgi:DDE superfamily endonuclease
MAGGGLPVRRHPRAAAAPPPLWSCWRPASRPSTNLAEISQCVGVSALLILDGAGWPSSPQLIVPENIVLLPLPPYAPELNAVENIWEHLRSNWLSHCVFASYEAILDACCDAWNALIATSEVITSIGTRDWAQVKI